MEETTEVRQKKKRKFCLVSGYILCRWISGATFEETTLTLKIHHAKWLCKHCKKEHMKMKFTEMCEWCKHPLGTRVCGPCISAVSVEKCFVDFSTIFPLLRSLKPVICWPITGTHMMEYLLYWKNWSNSFWLLRVRTKLSEWVVEV